MNQQPVTIHEPRALTRVVYGHAIRMAVTEGERSEYQAALGWYELKWQTQDRQAQQAQAAQPAPNETPKEPRSPSAVEEYGVDSPQA